MRFHRAAAAAASLAAVLAGCAGTATPTSSAPAAPASTRSSGIVVASGHGWTSAGLEGPMPAPRTCHLRTAADGEPLPDPRCTPGAVDAAVTDSDIGSTACRRGGYTGSVRPPLALTEPAKRRLMAAYGLPVADIGRYELDHLVDLAAGGASDVRNLWPEPNTFLHASPSRYVHNDKDQTESDTFHAICARKVSVTAVQNAMASDWTTAGKLVHG